jgi:hypothetical membrane protein
MARLNSRVAGVFFLVASAQFLVALVVAEALYPGYSVADNYISDLGVGPSAGVFNTSAILFGGLALVGVACLPRTRAFRGLIVLLCLMAVGAVGVGVFTSAYPVLHGAVSLMAFGFGGLAAIASVQAAKGALSAVSVGLGVMTLAALTLFAAGLVTTGALTSSDPPISAYFLGLGPGGMERLIVYPALVWLTVFSGHLMTRSETQILSR